MGFGCDFPVILFLKGRRATEDLFGWLVGGWVGQKGEILRKKESSTEVTLFSVSEYRVIL